MTDKLYLVAANKIAELIANAKDYDAEKISALLQSLPMVEGEPVAELLLSRGGHGIVVEWHKTVPVGAKLYTSPQPLQPITAEMVTDEMVKLVHKNRLHSEAEIIAAIYNAVIKNRSEAK